MHLHTHGCVISATYMIRNVFPPCMFYNGNTESPNKACPSRLVRADMSEPGRKAFHRQAIFADYYAQLSEAKTSLFEGLSILSFKRDGTVAKFPPM